MPFNICSKCPINNSYKHYSVSLTTFFTVSSWICISSLTLSIWAMGPELLNLSTTLLSDFTFLMGPIKSNCSCKLYHIGRIRRNPKDRVVTKPQGLGPLYQHFKHRQTSFISLMSNFLSVRKVYFWPLQICRIYLEIHKMYIFFSMLELP